MKNKEKFIDEFVNAVLNDDLCEFVDKHCKHVISCKTATDCAKCRKKLMAWLDEEYKPEQRLSQAEYEMLKILDDIYNWIIRDSDGDLCLCSLEPSKEKYCWECKGFSARVYFLSPHLFQFIEWEDEEPYNIYDLINEYEKYHSDEKKQAISDKTSDKN